MRNKLGYAHKVLNLCHSVDVLTCDSPSQVSKKARRYSVYDSVISMGIYPRHISLTRVAHHLVTRHLVQRHGDKKTYHMYSKLEKSKCFAGIEYMARQVLPKHHPAAKVLSLSRGLTGIEFRMHCLSQLASHVRKNKISGIEYSEYTFLLLITYVEMLSNIKHCRSFFK